ncbi:MAG: hypothetical protein K9M57_08125 [Phycisphaerae bacterium]|nr:hypothetical protein [Phycisphaerae bacterium]
MSDKKNALLTCSASVFILAAVMTAVTRLMNLETVSYDEAQSIIQGRIGCWFFQADFWSTFPTLPSIHQLQILINPRALLITLPLLGFTIYLLRVRENLSFAKTAIACQTMAIVPWIFGMMALNGNTAPETAGPWLAVMLLGVFYATLTCCALASLELVKPKVNNRPKPQQPPSARERYYTRQLMRSKATRPANSPF